MKKIISLKKSVLLFSALLIIGGGALYRSAVRADQFEQQIRALQGQNAVKNQQRSQLLQEAASFQDAINILQGQITAIQNKIAELDSQKIQKEQEIAVAEAELERQKELLGQNIKSIYLNGKISTIEMLATSKNLSEFVDKQQYRESVKEKIKNSVDKITLLKAELKAQKEQLERLIADQQRLRGEVVSQQAEQQRLLNLTQAEKAAVESEIKANSAQIAELRRQQAIANAARFGSDARYIVDPSGYPWGGVQPFPNAYVDPWGMYKRQCVSYTAWKVANSGRYMPYWGGFGNANRWDNNARAAGIPVNGTPAVGSIAQTDDGPYGHVMYVEAVLDNGRILVSQYNFAMRGEYSEMVISAAGLNFIHF